MSEAWQWRAIQIPGVREPYGPPTEQHSRILELLDERMKSAEAAMAIEMRRLRKEWYGFE